MNTHHQRELTYILLLRSQRDKRDDCVVSYTEEDNWGCEMDERSYIFLLLLSTFIYPSRSLSCFFFFLTTMWLGIRIKCLHSFSRRALVTLVWAFHSFKTYVRVICLSFILEIEFFHKLKCLKCSITKAVANLYYTYFWKWLIKQIKQ